MRKAPRPATRPPRPSKETKELKGGLGGGGPLFSMGGPTPAAEEGEATEEAPST